MLDRKIENTQLFLDTAVEFAVVLVTAACGENGAIRIALQKIRDGPCPQSRIAQIVETEFEEVLACLGFAAGLFQKTCDVRQTERNANLRESAPLGHIWFIRISKRRDRRPFSRIQATPEFFKAYQALKPE